MSYRFKTRSTTPGAWAWKLAAAFPDWRFAPRSTTPGDWAWRLDALFPDGLTVQSGYRVYCSSDPAVLGDLVAEVPAGTLAAQLGQIADTDYWYTVISLSEAGLESLAGPQVRALIDDQGVLVLPAPNPLLSALAKPTAAGGARVEFAYSAVGQAGVGARVQIAEITSGVPDWAHPVGSGNLWPDGLTVGGLELSKTWAHGATVALAARALTADVPPVAGPETVIAPILALATPPAPVAGVTASVYA